MKRPSAPGRTAPAQTLPVYRAADLRVTQGANMGDALSFAGELILDDIYEVTPGARPARLSFHAASDTRFDIARDSEAGTPGAALHLDCALTLMSAEGQITDALVLVEVDGAGHVEEIFLLPLGAIAPQRGYRLVGIDTDAARRTFAEVGCVSFTRGTHITLGSGAQRPVEDLRPGDKVLTRDDGVQQVRWIGQSTTRATGDFAPIRIRAGTLNNTGDLVVSPDHRLFIYQRSDALGAGRPELLVKARHLVNGASVTVEAGGFVDYFQLLFDRHQIIYAEGIAAESMLVDSRTEAILPEDLAARLGALLPGHADRSLAGLDVSERLLSRPDTAELLRRASLR